MPQIQLLDGKKIPFQKSISGFELTKKISKSLEKSALIMEVDGELKDLSHEIVKDSTLILLSKGENLKVQGILNSKFLLISGKPINEQIARGGPFVMNTKSEILQAVNDYHNGNFVK